MDSASPHSGARLPGVACVAQNRLLADLRGGRFVLTVESPPLLGSRPLKEVVEDVLRLARWVQEDGRVTALTVSDRVRTDRDHDPVEVGARVVETTGVCPLVHWAGKARTARHLQEDLERGQAAGLSNFLLLTGDALREKAPEGGERYLDSVDAIRIARQQLPGSLLAAAVNPFKYREEALWGQYVKAAKKVRAGADFLMAQIGWDPRKLAEAAEWLRARGLRVPLLASVWLLTPRVASRVLRSGPLPGVDVPPDFLRCLEAEAKTPDQGRQRALHRAALQVVGARRLGLEGAHLCGVHTPRTLEELLGLVDEYTRRCPDLPSWQAAWQEVMRHPEGSPLRLVPERPYYVDDAVSAPAAATAQEVRSFHFLQAVDRWVFDHRSPVSRIVGGVLGMVGPDSSLGRELARVERVFKGPLVGCQLCGNCRLPHTYFVCPETCPKGLANGPCGGTQGNTCEFGDRECIHARVYRLAKHTASLQTWESTWVPPVPEEVRGSCSWIHHYRGKGSKAEVLPASHPLPQEVKDVAT
jgi:methylenetetrahydrofolate reductase (NADPH)